MIDIRVVADRMGRDYAALRRKVLKAIEGGKISGYSFVKRKRSKTLKLSHKGLKELSEVLRLSPHENSVLEALMDISQAKEGRPAKVDEELLKRIEELETRVSALVSMEHHLRWRLAFCMAALTGLHNGKTVADVFKDIQSEIGEDVSLRVNAAPSMHFYDKRVRACVLEFNRY